jgi:RNA polymerase sigma-32 factor
MTNALSLPLNLSTGSLDDYLASVNRVGRLDAEQERELAIRLRDQEDLEAARQLVLANLRFVVHVARGYMGYGLPLPDLIQEGNIGLMKAIKRYDPDVGVRLVSFAVHWIKAEIHEYIIQNWRIVKIATTKAQRKLFFNLRKYKHRLGWLSQDEAVAVAEDLGVELDTVYEMESRLSGQDVAFDLSDESEESDGHVAAPELFLHHENEDPSELLEDDDWGQHKQTRLISAIEALDERSRDIVRSRWLAEEKLTLHDLAERYSVSAERIRQLENTAMKRIRTHLEA